ncbi:MAG: ribose-phosphate diphosphokinase [Acidimicrobiales bacterium]
MLQGLTKADGRHVDPISDKETWNMRLITTAPPPFRRISHGQTGRRGRFSDLGIGLTESHLSQFANGETHCRFGESVRGSDVFIIQSHGALDGRSINDSIFEHLIMVDAARRASAKRITAVMPYYGYSRQDRKSEGREPITARLMSDLFKAAGASRLVSIDLHSGQIKASSTVRSITSRRCRCWSTT